MNPSRNLRTRLFGPIVLGVAVVAILIGSSKTGTEARAPTDAAIGAQAATDGLRALPLDSDPAPSAAASFGCDPADQLFASMFAGLTEAAFANAGISRDQFLAAMTGDRQTLKRYFEALGIAVNDAQLDTLIGMGLAYASGVPGAPGAPGLGFGMASAC